MSYFYRVGRNPFLQLIGALHLPPHSLQELTHVTFCSTYDRSLSTVFWIPTVKDIPWFIWYLLWLALIVWTISLHWIYPPIAFAFGAILLHNSVHGGPLRALVARMQAWRQVDLRRAQSLTFGGGLLLTVLAIPVVTVTNQWVEARQVEARRVEQEALQRREEVARAEQAAQEAKVAAAKAETARLQALQEAERAKVIEQARIKAEEKARQKQAEREAQQRKDDARRAVEAQEREVRQAQQVAQKAQEDADRAEAQVQEAAQKEMLRRAEEGTYTSSQVQDMCRDVVAQDYGVDRSAVIEQGGFIEKMDKGPRNMAFGAGRLWFWRPTFKIAGSQEAFGILCRVHDDGQVEVGPQ